MGRGVGGQSSRLRVTLVGVVLAVGAYVTWWDGPRRELLTQQRHELARSESELAAARQVMTRRRAVASEIVSLRTELNPTRRLEPARDLDEAVGGLLGRIDRLATESSLSLRGYARGNEQPHGLLMAWPTRVELMGLYRDVCVFLDRVSTIQPLVEVSGLTIRAADIALLPRALQIELTLTVFTYGEGEEREWVGRPGESAEAPSGACVASASGPRNPFARSPQEGKTRDEHAAGSEEGAGTAIALSKGRARPVGLAGVRVDELRLSGFVQSVAGVMAVVRGHDARTYFLRGDERLFDGVVAAVSSDRVVFLQHPADAVRDRAPREVVRRLPNVAEGGE